MGDAEQPPAEPEVRSRAVDRPERSEKGLLNRILRLGGRQHLTTVLEQRFLVSQHDGFERCGATRTREFHQLLIAVRKETFRVDTTHSQPSPIRSPIPGPMTFGYPLPLVGIRLLMALNRK